jgi:lambda family phage holin
MPNMPDKPDTWAFVFLWFSQHSSTIWAACMSLFMAVLRIFYAGGTWKDALIEGPMCVLLALSIIWGFEFIGLPVALVQPVGIWVGFVGVKKIARWADRFADTKLPKQEGSQ